ncbi:MAG: DUF4340 domain-containing protein [Rhodothermaceae bacterium]|nr:DUF4340 domain-containing protein [Rhodothermaceae bacterium]MYD20543.1 DUF4340 domain-containing protein [Rhodothermaceae bacterium]MYD56760.1 DUF4340 domain-containing protein [Rhodothermaceae bacterium]MYI42613.1 DUF4340 domain-containing protein [Rhodothermaceae bacterium]MYJ56707.1 DUF4340 domain-containing protein [Rhodothermaceae bacterium]
MQQKQTLVLGGTLVVLLIIAWISGVFDRNPSNVDVPELDLPTSEVTRISVTLPDITFTVEKQGIQWFMREPVDMPADSATVTRLLNELEDLSLNNRATSNPDRYGIYGIDSTATTVSLTWSDGAEDIVISRQGRDYMSIYVKIGDNPDVYSTNGRVTVSQDLDRWRDRQILDLGTGTVMSARVTRPDDTYEVSLNNGVWMVNGQPGDSLQVTNWIRRFSPLSADGFFDDIPVQILTDPSYRIDFSTSTNTTSSVQAMPAESAVAITLGGSQFTYRVYESRLKQLFPDPSSLTGE